MPTSRRDRLFNFIVCLIDAVGFPIGFAFFSFQTILPTFLRRCGASDLTIGALTALNLLIVFIPGLFIVGYLRRLRRVRGYVFGVGLVERLALLPLAPLAVLWGTTHPDRLIVATFVAVFVHSLAMGFNMPAYWVFVGKCVPPRWRGRLFGYAGGMAGLVGIGVDRLLQGVVFSGPDGGFPGGFSRGFLIGFLTLTVTVLPFAVAREPEEQPQEGSAEPVRWAALVGLWRGEPALRRFLQGQIVFVLTAVAGPFLVLYAQESLGAGTRSIALYTAIGVYAAAFGSLVAGWLADRLGNRPVLLAGMAGLLLAAGLALAVGTPEAFALVFLLWALAGAAVGIAGNNLVMELAGEPGRIGLYTSFFNVVTALPRAAAVLLGGAVAGWLGYRALFVLCAALALVAIGLTVRPARASLNSASP